MDKNKKTFSVFGFGSSLTEAEKDLDTRLAETRTDLGVTGKEVARQYEVQYYIGKDPKKGGIIGAASNYDEAVKNAQANSPVEITGGYNLQVKIGAAIELTKKEEKAAKEGGKGTPAGPDMYKGFSPKSGYSTF